MKIAESWLREWVNPALDTEALAHQLTMLGHEVDDVHIEGAGLNGVVVGEVLAVEAHPDADRLSVCRVSAGEGEPVDVVCGALNVRTGMKSPLAPAGTQLPNGMKLRKSKIRGVVSNGMLCSADELGLGEDVDGIMDLPADAPAGQPLADYLKLPDAVFDVDLTPNRGDCFSVLGIARDVAALTGATLEAADVPDVEQTIDDTHPVEVLEPGGCPVFAGRVIRGIRPGARSPLWLIERLRRAGLRAIHPVVDVTNYVMLELGQPLHAYDLDRVSGPIGTRLSRAGEKVTLLDENEVTLEDGTMVITDDSGVIGLAGIMGGLSTAVSDSTTDVFFEAAYWPPDYMAGKARSYGLHTDASLRFERGVDPTGQARAIERATRLLIDIAGGQPGPLVETVSGDHLPAVPDIRLRRSQLERLLGTAVEDDTVSAILERLGIAVDTDNDGWVARPPPHRFDIRIEADLVEEVARIHGYDRIPETTETAPLPVETVTESRIDRETAAGVLIARDYEEVITYSFVDAALDELVTGAPSALALSNPISSEMSVMRASLLTGMLAAAGNNLSRQRDRVRLFEFGKSFHGTLDACKEVERIAGLVCGARYPEQWGSKPQAVDFFDIKADVEALLGLAAGDAALEFGADNFAALQPGQSAAVYRDGEAIGMLGKLHPAVAKRFDIKRDVYLFELDASKALASRAPTAEAVSRYPAIRRDIAVVVDDDVSASALVAAVRGAAPRLVRRVRIFDVYQGPGIEAGRKSIAIGLILQETSRTLTDDDADAAQAAAVQELQQKFAAVLRD